MISRGASSRAAIVALALVLLVPGLATAATVVQRFKATTIRGDQLDLDQLRRRGPVLIDFWATWCKPCVAALPEIQAIHRRFGPRGLTTVGISVDGPRNFAKVRPFVARLGLTYPIVLDQDGSLQSRFQVRAMPTTVLVDTSGMVVRVVQGYRPGEGVELAIAIEALLGAAPADSGVPDVPR